MSWPNGIDSVRQRDGAVTTKVDDRLGLACETVNVPRWMIVRIRDESDSAKPKRNHVLKYNPSGLGY